MPTPELQPEHAEPSEDELKPFSVKPEQNSGHENVRFGMELLNVLQPPAQPSAPSGAGGTKTQP